MSYNVDDPLAGILSDGSDDSFFDDDILGKKKPAKKKTTPTAEKKSALFDLDSDEHKVTNKLDAINDDKTVGQRTTLGAIGRNDSKRGLDFDTQNVIKPDSSKVVSVDKIKFDTKNTMSKFEIGKSPAKTKISASHDTLDILGELGVNKKENPKQLEKGKSSQSLLDDILGGSSKTGGSSQPNRPNTAAKSEFDFDSIIGKSEQKQTTAGKNTPQKQTPKVDNPTKEDNASKKKTSEDWLGIFQNKDENIDASDDETGMPAWLGGGDKKKKKTDNTKKTPTKQITRDVHQEAKEKVEQEIKTTEKEVQENLSVNIEQLQNVPNIGLLHASNEDIATEGASLYLQQQESQLMVALQLKAQEEKIAALQMRQKESQRVQREAALAHHSQLDAMLQRQASHRQQMQAIISAHQERITQRIKVVLIERT